jgi:hypothetical protein
MTSARLLPGIFVNGEATDPAQLALTGWWRDFPELEDETGDPWPGTASAGISGDQQMDDVDGNNRDELNGHGVLVNISLPGGTLEGTLDTYINALSFSFWLLIFCNDVSPQQDLLATSEASPTFEVDIQTSAARLRVNQAGSAGSVSKAIIDGVWRLVTGRYDGTNLQIGVNEAPGASGGGSTAAYSTSLSPLTGTVTFGIRFGDFDGMVAEIGITDQVLTDGNFSMIKSYINARYGLSL